MMTLKHRASNRINKIQVGQRWIHKHEEIFQEAINYFTNLLSVDYPLNPLSQNEILHEVPNIVSQDMNLELIRIPSHDEVCNAVFSFEGNKVPGPDDFPLFFF